ncbi:hypothetical protein B0H10DRAFT_2428226 [Mycena sp. CBHHK59/15]|nr:hypothetical protein B0H10DRAFT_2428226 [Mycena sp. CBHHK59/15]
MPHSAARDVRPPQKRRRIASNSSPQPIITVTEASPLKQHWQSKNTSTICTSCKRAVTTVAGLLLCARCTSPTCAICSRTCTACMPSQPPTPHLTWSPTPTPSPSHSPRRLALALNSANTNSVSATSASPVVTKRKKPRDDDEKSHDDSDEFACGSGCGRSVCRDCCFENPQESTTTCYDCYGR